MKMKMFAVNIPIAGSAYVEVEAETPEQAKAIALEKEMPISIDPASDVTIEQLDYFESITKGNVCYAPLWEIEIEEIEN